MVLPWIEIDLGPLFSSSNTVQPLAKESIAVDSPFLFQVLLVKQENVAVGPLFRYSAGQLSERESIAVGSLTDAEWFPLFQYSTA